jgi:homocysteine S-methyltransferase
MHDIKMLIERLINKDPILLSGAFGTELQRRGIRTKLPLWSTEALISHPDEVRKIHQDYIKEGAEIITTNTFRTNRRTLEKVGQGEDARKLTQHAVQLAKEARNIECPSQEVFIAGCMPPLEDCYSPDQVATDEELRLEHEEMAKNLADAGVDLIFVETMNVFKEAKIALEAAKKTGLEVMISFVCNEDGNLLSGESLKEVVMKLAPLNPIAVLVNCTPIPWIQAALGQLKETTIPYGVYANGDGQPADDLGWAFTGNMTAEKYLDHAKDWIEQGVSIVGGCCGTNPDYIRGLKIALKD